MYKEQCGEHKLYTNIFWVYRGNVFIQKVQSSTGIPMQVRFSPKASAVWNLVFVTTPFERGEPTCTKQDMEHNIHESILS